MEKEKVKENNNNNKKMMMMTKGLDACEMYDSSTHDSSPSPAPYE